MVSCNYVFILPLCLYFDVLMNENDSVFQRAYPEQECELIRNITMPFVVTLCYTQINFSLD